MSMMPSSRSSGSKTGNTQITTTRARVCGLSISATTPANPSAPRAILYDSASGISGNPMVEISLQPSIDGIFNSIIFVNPVMFENGIYLSIPDAPCKAIVYYAA